MQPDIDTYIARLRRRLGNLSREERDAVLAEVRTHLNERATELEAQGVPRDVAQREAAEAFGPPDEVAVQFRGGHASVRGRDQVLRLALRTGRAAGRGAGRVVRFTFATVAAVLVTVLLVAAVVLVAYKDVVERGLDEASNTRYRELFSRSESWGQPQTSTEVDTFVLGDVRSASVSITAEPHAQLGVGCIRVTVAAPDDPRFYDSGPRCGQRLEYSFGPAAPGTYRIEYILTGWAGELDADGVALERMERR